MKRIFVVDDHPLIRKSYAEEIDATPGLTVCGAAASFDEALRALPEARPSVVVVDVALGRSGAPDGLELIRRHKASMPAETRWLVVSAYDDAATVRRAQEAGAQGFLSKRHAGDALLAALHEEVNGTDAFRHYGGLRERTAVEGRLWKEDRS